MDSGARGQVVGRGVSVWLTGTVSDLQDEKALGTEGCWLHHVNALGTAEPHT